MSEAFGKGWKTGNIDANTLELDAINPRLDIKASSSQDQIRKALFLTEDVFGLIGQIVASDGLLAGERIIVIKQDGKLIVLEGNRRTTAVQVLLNLSEV